MDLPDMLNSEAWNDMSVETEKKDEFSIFHDPLEWSCSVNEKSLLENRA